jgi:hypothetical protein
MREDEVITGVPSLSPGTAPPLCSSRSATALLLCVADEWDRLGRTGACCCTPLAVGRPAVRLGRAHTLGSLLLHAWAAHTPRTRACTAPGWAVLGEAGPSCLSFLVHVYFFSNCVQTLKSCNLS